MRYDVCIVGGGVAGLSTALHICSKVDATILVLDKGEIGDPTKTSPFTFPETVEKFGLHNAVLQSYNIYTYRSPSGVSATWKYSKPVFVTLDYQELCKNLFNRARKEGSLEVLQNTKVVDFEVNKGAFEAKNLKLKLSGNEEIRTNILVDASGKSFLAARKLGIGLPQLYSHSYGEVLECCKIENPAVMHILSGAIYGNGGGWFYPLNANRGRFGIAQVTKSLDYPKFALTTLFSEACRNFSPYNEMVEGSRSVRPEFGTIPIGAIDKICFDRILIVGDAAGQATPWFCEGVRPALESGEICGKVVAEAYETRDYSFKSLARYQEEWDMLNRRRYTLSYQRSCDKWFRTQEEWDRGLKRMSSLTPKGARASIKYGELIPRFESGGFSYPKHVTKLISSVKRVFAKKA
jgi:flavin-dependent dehydrogenase